LLRKFIGLYKTAYRKKQTGPVLRWSSS